MAGAEVQLQTIIDDFERVAGMDRDDAAFHHACGIVYAISGMTEAAETSYDRATKTRPGRWEARYSLGVLYAGIGEHGCAMREFELALGEKPDSVRIYLSQIGVDSRLNRLVPFALSPLYEEYRGELIWIDGQHAFSAMDPFKVSGCSRDAVDLIRNYPDVFPGFYWFKTGCPEEKSRLVQSLDHHGHVLGWQQCGANAARRAEIPHELRDVIRTYPGIFSAFYYVKADNIYEKAEYLRKFSESHGILA